MPWGGTNGVANGVIDLTGIAATSQQVAVNAEGQVVFPYKNSQGTTETATLQLAGVAAGALVQLAPDGTSGTDLLLVNETATVNNGAQFIEAANAIAALPANDGLSYTIDLNGSLTLSAATAAATSALAAPPAGVTIYINDAGAAPGAITVAAGAGAALGGVNSFSGGVTVDAGGALELASAQAAGTGTITLAGGGDTLKIEGASLPSNAIAGFGLGDTIDLTGLALTPGLLTTNFNGALSIPTASGTQTLELSGLPAGVGIAATSDGHGGTDLTEATAPQTLIVTNASELNDAINEVNSLKATQGLSVTIDFNAPSGVLSLTQDLAAINLPSGVTLTIDGKDETLNGGGVAQGLFVFSGDVAVENLTIEDLVARGGNGADGSGGGAGLGGGVFVASAGDVSLLNVNLIDDKAIGGNGGGHGIFGGGGGLGGAGGRYADGVSGGGGGIGQSASGGAYLAGAGGAGIVGGAGGGGATVVGGATYLYRADITGNRNANGYGGGGGGGGAAGIGGGGGGGIGGRGSVIDAWGADSNGQILSYTTGGGAGGFGGGGGAAAFFPLEGPVATSPAMAASAAAAALGTPALPGNSMANSILRIT